MKLKDIEGALSLIAAFKNADWVEEHLKGLLEAKALADKAIAEQKSIQAGNEASRKALDALMADHKRQEESLADRELQLKDAQEQHRFNMEQESAGLAAQEKRLNERYEAMNAEHAKQCEARAAEAAALDKREKALDQRQLKLESQERELEQRAAQFRAANEAFESKVKKVRELTA